MTRLGFGWAYLVGGVLGIAWAASQQAWPVVVNLALLWVLVVALSIKTQRLAEELRARPTWAQQVLNRAQQAAARPPGPLIVPKPQKES